MSEVESFLKADPTACVCGCGKVGTLRRKQWRDGLGPHVRGCECRRCVGGRQKPKAYRREMKLAKALGGERSVMSGALNGADITGPVDIEETANVSVTRGFERWVYGKGVTSKVARLYKRENGAPKALVLTLSNGEQWAVLRVREDLVPLVLSATDEVGGA